MAKIIIEREKCIGCGTCQALCPKQFELIDDGKASLIGGKRDAKTGNDNIETDKLGCAEAAADSCPVQCIHIEK